MTLRWRVAITVCASALVAVHVYNLAVRTQQAQTATQRRGTLDSGAFAALYDVMRAVALTDEGVPPPPPKADALLAPLWDSGFMPVTSDLDVSHVRDLRAADIDVIDSIMGNGQDGG